MHCVKERERPLANSCKSNSPPSSSTEYSHTLKVMRNAELTPDVVVQRQLDAYNARDVEALLAVYAEDAHMFEHPSKLLASGADQLRERFIARFQEPNLRAALRQRILMGNFVVDHEEVTRTFPEGTGKVELIMIYEVRQGRIAKAWSIAGPTALDREA